MSGGVGAVGADSARRRRPAAAAARWAAAGADSALVKPAGSNWLGQTGWVKLAWSNWLGQTGWDILMRQPLEYNHVTYYKQNYNLVYLL